MMSKDEMNFQVKCLMSELLAEDKGVRLFWELVKFKTLLDGRICKYGHKIHVSRCSKHHKELK